jgi:ElaB/YqjD/DUF883 family membrane-anchored ribosome-binding protein
MDPKQAELNRRDASDSFRDGGSSEDIRRQIERRRADMDVLASTLAQRLDPHQLADEVATAVKRKLASRGERIRTALADSVKENPVPWLLVGGGLGWLIVRARSSRGSEETALQLRSDYDVPGYDRDRYDSGSSGLYSEPGGAADEGIVERGREKASELGHKMGEATSRAKDKVAEATSSVKESVAEATDRAKEKLADATHETGAKVRSAMATTRRKTSDMVDDRPLLFGGVALAVGTLLGMSIPTSSVEDRWMGEQRDRLLDRAKDKGEELLDRGKEVVSKATELADAATSSSSSRDTPSRAATPRGDWKAGAPGVVR